MRLVLALLALALVVLGVLWLTDRPAASRGNARRGLEPVHAAPAPVADEPDAPPSVRRAATEPEAPAATTPEPDAFPRTRLAGRVRRFDGAPAAGVTLEIRAQHQRGRPRPLATLRTADDGSFETRVLGTGPFRLEASETSGGGVRLAAALEPVPGGSEEAVLVLPRSGRIRGRVVDDRGQPVRAFTLELEPERDGAAVGAPVRATLESEDGRFESEELAQGDWQLVVWAAGHGPSAPRRCRVPNAAPESITLPRAGRLSGVVRGADGRPRAGARVELSGAREPVFADADGAFTIAGGAGPAQLWATDPSSLASVALALVVTAGEERAGLVLQLGASGGVSGRVVTLANRPAAGRSVHFRSLPEGEGAASPPPAVTDALGRFLTDLPPGLWEASVALDAREIEALELAAPGEERPFELRASEQVRVRNGETAEVWLALAPAPVRVSGALRKAGEPCQGGEVVALDPRDPVLYRARVEGAAYALGLARPGLHQFRITFGNTTRLLWVDVPADATHELDLDVPVGWIEGFVRTWEGERAADVKVWARAAPGREGSGHGHALTGADGTFVLELAPGDYEIGTEAEEPGRFPRGRARQVTVLEGERGLGLELVLLRGPSVPALEVVLHGPRGELVEGGRVRVLQPELDEPLLVSQEAPLGSAAFASLPASEVEVTAEAPGYFLPEFPRLRIERARPQRVELALERTREVIVLVRATSATGPVHALDAVTTRGLVFGAESTDTGLPLEPGTHAFRFPGLPLGPHRLRVSAGEQLLERPLQVDGGGPPLRAEIVLP